MQKFACHRASVSSGKLKFLPATGPPHVFPRQPDFHLAPMVAKFGYLEVAELAPVAALQVEVKWETSSVG